MKTGCVVYIPGFNSTSDTALAKSFKQLAALHNWDFLGLEYIGSYDPKATALRFYNEVKNKDVGNYVFVGKSFGGFWANAMAIQFGEKCCVMNPAMDPDHLLCDYGLPAELYSAYTDFIPVFISENPTTVILCEDDPIINAQNTSSMFKDSSAKVVMLNHGGHSGDNEVFLCETAKLMTSDFISELS